METKINQIQKEFQERIVAGDYQITDYKDSYVDLLIDEKYLFSLWVGKEWRFVTIWVTSRNFMQLPEFTEEEQKTIYAEITKLMSENAQAIKDKKINDLKLELAKLEGESK